jgi:predicted RNA methylase
VRIAALASAPCLSVHYSNWNKAVLAPILAKADIRPHERVLDLGCGSGETTFAWILPSAGRVLAVDADPEMVAAAQNLLQAQPESLRSKCTFEVRDGQALGDFKQKFVSPARCGRCQADIQ